VGGVAVGDVFNSIYTAWNLDVAVLQFYEEIKPVSTDH
jgi:hypothetical protein